MKVLIITPFFFDYHKRIKRALEEKGAEVTLIDERPNKSTLTKIFLRKDFRFYRRKRDEYFWNLLTLKDDFDYILYVKCESPTENALHFLKEHFSKAKHILYLWDSVKNIKNIESKFKYFDEIYSFDNDDVSKYPFMTYAYWGYTKEFENKEDFLEYDLAFVGTLHSIRPKVIEEIEEQCKNLGLKFYKYVFMPHKIVYWYNRIFNPYFKNVFLKEINFKPLSTEETIKIYQKSKAVLEIENIYQSGATTRLGEMIGMEKKIVTTFDCRNMDFYRENNQLVLDVNKVKINKEFFKTPYEKIPQEIKEKYSFDNFINTVFKGE